MRKTNFIIEKTSEFTPNKIWEDFWNEANYKPVSSSLILNSTLSSIEMAFINAFIQEAFN